MKKIIVTLTLIALFVACGRNSVTNRRQLKLIPEAQLQAQALTEYRSFLSTAKVVSTSGSRDAEMVNRVGKRVAAAITQYYTAQNKASVLEGFEWEFNLVNDKQVNAWCMPGGKVVVYSGLLGVTQNEAALAVVMGHEICHAVAHHGNERMSNGLLAQGVEVVGNIFTQNNEKVNSLFNQVFAPGVQVLGILPNSRTQEYEADKFGLIFSALSGYNPQEAVPFWTRMASAGGGQKPPEFLSTHPSDENRIARLQSFMPEALTYYKPIQK